MATRNCVVCGAEFIGRDARWTTCGPECSQAKRSDYLRAYRQREEYKADSRRRAKVRWLTASPDELAKWRKQIAEYRRSHPIGREKMRVYRMKWQRSLKGRASRERFKKSPKGRKLSQLIAKRYRDSLKGKPERQAAKQAYMREYLRNWKRAKRVFLRHLSFTANLEAIMKAVISTVQDERTSDGAFDRYMDVLRSVDADLESKTDDELLGVIQDGFKIIRDVLVRMSRSLLILDARGRQVDGADPYWLNLLRRIGLGDTHVDIVVRFAKRGHVLDALKNKPMVEQLQALDMSDDEVEAKYRRKRSALATKPELPKAKMPPAEVAEFVRRLIADNENPYECARLSLPVVREFLPRTARPKAKKRTRQAA